jgi:DNA-binding MarR family transcriptional regulator
LVGGLTEAGLLARDRHDARAVRLRVTGTARQRIDAWSQCSARVLDSALADMRPDDRHQIIKALPALKRLAQSLEQNAAAGADRLDRSPRS